MKIRFNKRVELAFLYIAVMEIIGRGWVRATLKNDLGKWKAAKPYARVLLQFFADLKNKTESVQTNDKTNAMFVTGLKFPMRDDDPITWPYSWPTTFWATAS